MKRDIEDLKKELVKDIKALAADIASSHTYVGLLANEIKFRSLQEKFINLKFLERKNIGLEIFETSIPTAEDYTDPDFSQDNSSTLWDSDSFQEMQLEQELAPSAQSERKEEETKDVEETSSEESDAVDRIKAADDYAYLVKEEKIYAPISLDFNDQLAFQYQLFDGDRESMDMVIRTLNAIKSLEDSKKYLTDLQIEMDWKDKNEYVERLEELVINRFE